LWINPDDGITQRWNGSSWEVVTDSELEKLAESKAQIFTSEPVPPYYVGDLWVQGSNYTGDIKHCIKDRVTGSYNASDWVISSKYTDDTVANQALEQAKQGIIDAAEANQEKVMTLATGGTL
jgi:phage-related protein